MFATGVVVSTGIWDFPFLMESHWLQSSRSGNELCVDKDDFVWETRDVFHKKRPPAVSWGGLEEEVKEVL